MKEHFRVTPEALNSVMDTIAKHGPFVKNVLVIPVKGVTDAVFAVQIHSRADSPIWDAMVNLSIASKNGVLPVMKSAFDLVTCDN